MPEPTTVPLELAGFAWDYQSIRTFAERDHKKIVSTSTTGAAPSPRMKPPTSSWTTCGGSSARCAEQRQRFSTAAPRMWVSGGTGGFGAKGKRSIHATSKPARSISASVSRLGWQPPAARCQAGVIRS